MSPKSREHELASAELVIEVAASSQRRDLLIRTLTYAAAGVPVDLDTRRAARHAS
jgi:hypothetical protein